MLKIAIVNAAYPPNMSPPGVSANKVASYIREHLPEAEISVFCTEGPAAPRGKKTHEPVGRVHSIRRMNLGQHSALRLLSRLIEGRTLVRKAIEEADVVISLTDPPFLNLWAARLIKRKKKAWVYWTMDLYPEYFCESGLLKKDGLITRWIDRKLQQTPPDLLIALGTEQASYIQSKFAQPAPQVVLPCGVHTEPASPEPPVWRESEELLYFGYAGSLSSAHSRTFLIDLVAELDPERHRCVLALLPSKFTERVRERLKNHPAVRFIDFVTLNDLHYVDVHLASLLPNMTHVCVPSKLVSAICCDSTFIYCASPEADGWVMFEECGWTVDARASRSAQQETLGRIVREIDTPRLLAGKRQAVIQRRLSLQQGEIDAYRSIVDFVSRVR